MANNTPYSNESNSTGASTNPNAISTLLKKLDSNNDGVLDEGLTGTFAYSDLTGVPTTFAPSSHTHTMSNVSGTLPTTQGGTGLTTLGTTGQVLTVGSSGLEYTTVSGTGTVTSVAGGNGLTTDQSAGAAIDGSGTLSVDINGATDGTSDGTAQSGDQLLIADASASNAVKRINVSQLPAGGGGETNQNAWSTITVPTAGGGGGSTTQSADQKTDSIAFTASGGMTITGGADDTIDFSSANTTYTNFVGDDGAGGDTTAAGLVPAPSEGDAAAGKYLDSDGSWTVPPDTGDTTYTAGDGLTLDVQEFNADLAANPGLKLTASDGSGKLALDLNSLSLDSTVSSTGWSEGDQIAVIDSATTDDPTKKAFLPAEIGIACSDETTAITPAEVKATIMVPRKMKVTEVKVSLTTPDSSGGGLQVQVHDHGSSPANSGTSMLTSAINTSDGYYATSTAFAGGWDQVLDANHFVKVEVTNLGMGAAAGLKVWLLGYWA